MLREDEKRMRIQDYKFMIKSARTSLPTSNPGVSCIEQHDMEKRQAPRFIFVKNNKHYSFNKHMKRINDFTTKEHARKIKDLIDEINEWSYEHG